MGQKLTTEKDHIKLTRPILASKNAGSGNQVYHSWCCSSWETILGFYMLITRKATRPSKFAPFKAITSFGYIGQKQSPYIKGQSSLLICAHTTALTGDCTLRMTLKSFREMWWRVQTPNMEQQSTNCRLFTWNCEMTKSTLGARVWSLIANFKWNYSYFFFLQALKRPYSLQQPIVTSN